MPQEPKHAADQGNTISYSEETAHPALDASPRISNRYYHLIRELHAAVETATLSFKLRPQDQVLDYGCATMRYRNLFPEGCNYVGADLPGNELANVLLDPDGRVPLPDASFDAVISTQVLEHVEDPVLYLNECRRLLKPGGRLLLSTHGLHVYHPCPNDYWRWTYTGLERVINQAGFTINQTQGVLGGIPATLQLLQELTVKKLPGFLQPLFFSLFQSLIVASDRLYSADQRPRNACILLVTATADL